MERPPGVVQAGARDTLRNYLLIVIAVVLCLIAVYHTRAVVVPVLFAGFLTILIYPLARALSRWLPFWASVAAIILGLSAAVAVAGIFVVGTVRGLIEELPRYGKRLDQIASPLLEYARQRRLPLTTMTSEEDARALARFIGQGLTSVGWFLGELATVMLLTVFALAEVPRFRARVLRACGQEKGEACLAVLAAIAQRLMVFLWTKTWISAATGVAIGIACYAIGIDFAPFWAFLGFALNFVPYIGQPLAIAPPILLAFIQFESRAPGVVAAIVLIVIQVLNANVLDPLAMRNALRISALFLLVSVVLWGWLLGLAGVVLGTPLSVAFVVTCEHVEGLKPVAALLAEPLPSAPGHRSPLETHGAPNT